jgi:hypothetical protein
MHHRKEITNFGTSLAKRTPYFGTSYVGKITRFGISLLEKSPNWHFPVREISQYGFYPLEKCPTWALPLRVKSSTRPLSGTFYIKSCSKSF